MAVRYTHTASAEFKESATKRRERERAERARQAREEQEREEARERARRAREDSWRSRQDAAYSARRAIMEADKAIATEIINAGYRALSLKNHPDRGGSHDKMVAINRVCDQLRLIIAAR